MKRHCDHEYYINDPFNAYYIVSMGRKVKGKIEYNSDQLCSCHHAMIFVPAFHSDGLKTPQIAFHFTGVSVCLALKKA